MLKIACSPMVISEERGPAVFKVVSIERNGCSVDSSNPFNHKLASDSLV